MHVRRPISPASARPDSRCHIDISHRAQSKLYGQLPSGPEFTNESVFFFTLGASAEPQITGIKEFVDTKLLADFAAAAAGAS